MKNAPQIGTEVVNSKGSHLVGRTVGAVDHDGEPGDGAAQVARVEPAGARAW